MDLKINKKIKNNYFSDRKNILILKNFFNLNISKKNKKNNSNNDVTKQL